MSSVSTAFKVHYNQKLGDPFGHLWGMHHGLWGIDAPAADILLYAVTLTFDPGPLTFDL